VLLAFSANFWAWGNESQAREVLWGMPGYHHLVLVLTSFCALRFIYFVVDDLFGQLHLIAGLLAFHCDEEMVKYKASGVWF
jgi:hypothetical protein